MIVATSTRAPRLILASGSAARKAMLEAAGLTVEVVRPEVDEAAIREQLRNAGEDADPDDLAELLAVAKAAAGSLLRPGSLVIGGDQVLALGTDMIEKAESRAEARRTLERLRGRLHHLHSAAAIAQDGEVLWSHVETAALQMRAFSPEFLEHYLESAGDAILGSVGCYHFEGLGVQLFEDVAGDHFTILGLPLLPLLAELRDRGALGS
jgi:septum formation protein